jgi:hypothetical protein
MQYEKACHSRRRGGEKIRAAVQHQIQGFLVLDERQHQEFII